MVAKGKISEHEENQTPSFCLIALRIVDAVLGFSRAFHMEPSEKRNAVIVRKLLLLICYAGQSTQRYQAFLQQIVLPRFDSQVGGLYF
jgi:hypothetical protein